MNKNKHYSVLGINLFSREPNCLFNSYLKALCIETSISMGFLQKFEGAAGELKGAQGVPAQVKFEP